MLEIKRHHDFQLFLSPSDGKRALTNPPSFNWPQPKSKDTYRLVLECLSTEKRWQWDGVSSPLQLDFHLPNGQYKWTLIDSNEECSDTFHFFIDEQSPHYLPPTAEQLFALCDQPQFMLYFDDDIDSVRAAAQFSYDTLKKTEALGCHIDDIQYPNHHRRGQELGKRTAIDNVRLWIDRDLITSTLLFKIWDDQQSGIRAREILLTLAQWSPEGTASVMRPCTWGDEVGLSLCRNLFLAYHWLSPLLTEPEKSMVRPMLIRMAHQMELRLESDEFHQFPGHSHTSRIPGYLGVAALVLHQEYDADICRRWLEYALMIYKGILPFYGRSDGSWAEGPFYSSSYTKWHHPFFLAVERLSQFSFYEHPFYKNYSQFAMDFVVPDYDIHPFGDGFWCRRESVEWPGFFSQNPLRIYAERFGNVQAKHASQQLEAEINGYSLHLLDIIPTRAQIGYQNQPVSKESNEAIDSSVQHRFYSDAGVGKTGTERSALLYRASLFGNSSHRHADQGNIALFDGNLGVLTPTGSYGYCFGSSHHTTWTRTTLAHNLPLIDGSGQILDSEAAIAHVTAQGQGNDYSYAQLDLSAAYSQVQKFIRTVVFIAEIGIVVYDHIELMHAAPVQWRMHSYLDTKILDCDVTLTNDDLLYHCSQLNHPTVKPTLEHGYNEPVSGAVIQSDAVEDVSHFEWELPQNSLHQALFTCTKHTLTECKLENNTLIISYPNGQITVAV
ncbi:heparinase II/III domain-containing protein [Vibrio ezurae]|uniref:Heparinase II/III-like C-terminal domain-containing protein n=1 Tax=Vibrio ezurae NBRC 102218 TaxID=1219080 RepID=U3CGK9_9VIBR|nr:heparinase II/III family protein [Vibrio ezurae]GAD80349.1 hypothetical protein VEZ01S_33_00510 [Vibrio ezurae NBRC 102218]